MHIIYMKLVHDVELDDEREADEMAVVVATTPTAQAAAFTERPVAKDANKAGSVRQRNR